MGRASPQLVTFPPQVLLLVTNGLTCVNVDISSCISKIHLPSPLTIFPKKLTLGHSSGLGMCISASWSAFSSTDLGKKSKQALQEAQGHLGREFLGLKGEGYTGIHSIYSESQGDSADTSQGEARVESSRAPG